MGRGIRLVLHDEPSERHAQQAHGRRDERFWPNGRRAPSELNGRTVRNERMVQLDEHRLHGSTLHVNRQWADGQREDAHRVWQLFYHQPVLYQRRLQVPISRQRFH